MACRQPLRAVARRMIHACGMTDLVDDLAWHGDPVAAARRALAGGAPILTDAQMVAAGIIRAPLPEDRDRLHASPRTRSRRPRAGSARRARPQRSSCGASRLHGAVVAIGNAPTALFHLLELIEAGGPAPGGDLRLSRSASSAPRNPSRR